MKLGKIERLLLLSVLLGSFSVSTFAQDYDDVYIDDVEDVLNNEQIDIDGAYTQRPKKTAADRLSEMRRKLEQKNEQMVQKRIEDMRIEQEKKLSGKLQNAFEGKVDDSVSTKAAAPVKEEKPPVVIVKKAPPVKPAKPAKTTKLIPSFGGSSIQGERVDFESNIDFGVSIESMFGKNFSVGVGVNYSSMDIAEYDLNYYNNCGSYSPYGGLCQQGSGYYNWYNNSFNEGRQVKYKQVGIELNSKLFLGSKSRIRPYLAGGLGLNRATLKYDGEDQLYAYNQPNPNNYQFSLGQERHTFLFTSGKLGLGAEVLFSDEVGLDINAFYQRTLSSTGEKSEAYSTFNPDLRRLENLGEQIKDADVLGIKAGVIVAF